MGNQDSKFSPSPNVRERHSRALYINIPIKKSLVECFTLFPCECDTFDNSTWLSIVIDDLDSLESHLGGGIFFNVSNQMRGWMCKVNLLVKGAVPILNTIDTKEVVSGYQILSLDFEEGWGGDIKRLGAIYTQAVPTTISQFVVTSGLSGSSINYDLIHEEKYSTEMTNPKDSSSLVVVSGKLNSSLSVEQLEFAKFVTNRPHKFLHQSYGTPKASLAYSPEIGEGAQFESYNCVWLEVEKINLPILNRLDERISEIVHQNLAEVKCFIQPSYTLVDHHNTAL
jgi:hypothetical protein